MFRVVKGPDVDQEKVKQFMGNLLSMLLGCKPEEDVLNAYEINQTNFSALPDKIFTFKSEKCGGKTSKDRLWYKGKFISHKKIGLPSGFEKYCQQFGNQTSKSG